MMKALRYRLAYWVALLRMWFQSPIKHDTNDCPKWFKDHNLGCCWYAPDEVCICASVQRTVDHIARERRG